MSNTSTKKPTKRENFLAVKALIENDHPDLAAFIDHEIELLNNKKSSKGMTAKQEQNADIADAIAEYLLDNGQKKVSELLALPVIVEILGEVASSQKISQIVNRDDRFIKVTEGKNTYFKAAEVED